MSISTDDDAELVGAWVVDTEPEQFNDVIRSDREQPGPQSFDVLAPDGYLHAMRLDDESGPALWQLAVAGPPTTVYELVTAATQEIAMRGGGLVTWWRASSDSASDRVAARAGFEASRSQHELRVQLPVSFDAAHARDLHLDDFDADRDAEEWLRINNAAFEGHPEQGSWTLADLEARLRATWFDPTLFIVARAHRDGPIIGFNWMKLHAATSREPRRGEIYVIGVDPASGGKGLGYALAGVGLQRLHARGVTVGTLFVAADNARAMALYRKLGFATHRTDTAYTNAVSPI